MAIDWDFIAKEESRRVLKGYVPTKDGKVIQKSGVTIATGCDIGQMTSSELKALGLPGTLTTKLLPYVELRQDAALRKLRDLPLEITAEEAKTLDRAIHGTIMQRFIRNYEMVAGIKFDSLPPAAQTVLASLAINWGPNFYRKQKGSWALAVARDWKGLADRLSGVSANDPLDKRREREAALLRTIT